MCLAGETRKSHEEGQRQKRLPEGGWNELERLLDDIGSIHGWPEARELVTWLTGTVVPRLRWALEGAVPKDLDEGLTGRLAAIAALSAKRKRAQNDNAEPAAASAA